MSEGERRIRQGELRQKVTTAEEAAGFFRDGMVVATSGTGVSGYPRAVFGALRERIKNGDPLRIDLLCTGPLGPEIEDALAEVGGIRRRIGTVGSKLLRQAINRREVGFLEGKSGKLSQYARQGYYGKIDVAVIETAGINEAGQIIPATCVYEAPDWVDLASSVVLEINLRRPLGMEGFHDIYYPEPGHYIPLNHPLERIGSPYIRLDPAKVRHIVFADMEDREIPPSPPGEKALRIAKNIEEFLKKERERQGKLPPLEVGFGEVVNGFLSSLTRSSFSSLIFYLAVATDPLLDLIDAGKVQGVSCNSLRFSASALRRFFDRLEHYRPYFIFRPITLTNSAEMLSRFGVLAINSGLEADIQGQVNSSHLRGSQLIGGIAGSYDFGRNSSISIFALPSTSQQGKVSSIVPRVSHVDHTEHEVDVLITEHGIADLRALEPYERAQRIIEQCADARFQESLKTYVEKARLNPGRIPILLGDESGMEEEGKKDYKEDKEVIKKGRIKVMQGNEACVEAAILAGCRFFAGYPITPATEILEGMARRLPLVDGFCLQAEDEIAAICAVSAASWGGAKAMTATSGPGFCLMQEGIGAAASVESPCVIVNVQRGGPASGQSTSTAQGDLYQARYGSNGDYSLITLCPSTSQEMFDQTIRAFSLAERFRIPVIILSDEVVAHIREKVFIPDPDQLEIINRKRPTVPMEEFVPFAAEEDGVPPMPDFNTGYKVPVISQCKGPYGTRGNAQEAAVFVRRLTAKVERHLAEFSEVLTYGDETGEIAFVSFGSVCRAARSAVDMGREQGLSLRSVEVKTIWPFPDDLLRMKLEGAKRIVVAEMNLGMLFHEVRRVIRRPEIPIELFCKLGGIYPQPEEFLRFLEEKR